jgi:amino acid adenylation domain-containing protein
VAQLIYDAFLAQARHTPHHVAVCVGDDRITYAELADRAQAVRTALACGPPGPAAGVFEHCVEGVAAFLGTLGSGRYYLPLAPIQGPDLIAYATKAAATVLTALPSPAAEVSSQPHHLAYAIHTSGSTGRPKAVAVSQSALAASTSARLRLYGDGGTLFLAAPFCFDSSLAMFAPLISGGTVLLSSPAADHDPILLAHEAAAATHTLLLPSVYAEMLDVWGDVQPAGLMVAIVAGEAVVPAVVDRHFALAPHRRLVNEYGPSEATIFCTAHDCRPGEDPVPIGRPAPGYRLTLLGPDGFPVPDGVTGEICVGGPGLADGYLGDPGRTALQFIPADLPHRPSARWYRTGDLGRRRPDGVYEYHGRLDDQVKIRGVRVELAAVDALLAGVPGVTAAASTIVDGRLIGFVVGRAVQRADLPSAPAYLVPHDIHEIAELPRTASGKIDRRALATLPRLTRTSFGPFASASAPLSALLTAAEQVLRFRPDPGELFVDCGDSLAAMRVTTRLYAAGWRLDPTRLLDGSTVERAATAMRPAQPPVVQSAAIGRLSPSQSAVWYAHQLHPDTTAYTISLRVRIDGLLDPERCESALRAVVSRHPVLGCRIVDAAMVPDPEPAILDLADAPTQAIADQLAALEEQTPIDPNVEPPLRALLVLLPDRSELLLSVHHVVCDGPSLHLMLRELADAYNGASTSAPTDFREYAARATPAPPQRAWLAAQALADVPAISLRDDPATVARLRPSAHVGHLHPPLVARLRGVARAHRTTLYAVLLTGFAQALHEVAGITPFALGTVTSTRPAPALEQSIGQYTNIVPVVVSLDPSAPVESVRSGLLAALRYADVPFAQIAAELRSTAPPVLFEYLADAPPEVLFDGMPAHIDLRTPGQGAVCDLYLRVFPNGDALRWVAVHDASVVSESTMDKILAALDRFWGAI